MKRAKAKQHTRRTKSGKIVIVNKGVSKKSAPKKAIPQSKKFFRDAVLVSGLYQSMQDAETKKERKELNDRIMKIVDSYTSKGLHNEFVTAVRKA